MGFPSPVRSGQGTRDMLDDKFLEFWGTFLLTAAREKKQMDEMVRMMQKGFPDPGLAESKSETDAFQEAGALFRKFYGLNRFFEYSDDYGKMVRKAMSDYQDSFKEYMVMMGVVPRKEHVDLVQKYEKLKKTCVQQEETIRHLQLLLNVKDKGQGDAVQGLQDIMKDQSELFKKMMNDFTQYLGNTVPELKKENSERSNNATDSND
jgi:rubrerythrin